SSMGVDLNRNFPYQWGYDNIGSSPSGSDETYRGPSASSEPETNAIRAFVNSRPIVAMQSYHSYSNLMLYPYGYADIQCEEPWHTGYVTMTDLLSAGNGYATGTAWELLYNTNGDAVDWGHGATGEHPRIMTITTEVGSGSDGFWPAESRIPALVAENLEPNLLFAEMAGNPWSALPPAAPSLAEPGAVGSNYTLSWNTPSPDPNNPALSYDVQQLGGLSQGSDDFSSTTNWTPGGTPFVLSAARAFSAPSSYYGGTGNNRNAISTLSGSLQVTPGMQVSLRAWYDIENDWDYAYVELSTNGVSWSPIAGSITTNSNPNGTNEGNGITGGSAGFVAATFPLAAWVGQTVQLRLRYRTDGAVLGEGIYIDDFAPVQTFTSSQIIA
ncbi:MAG: immune inhibitor A, partial [Candidatus Cloacimonetes bacterium]|nr:immune inhibitor A [Candidatus Cloacimonadota bacterium]